MTKTQSVLITGSTAGIGRHAALHLARAGHHVIATGRNAQALETLKAEAADLRLDVVPLDVTDRGSIAEAVERVRQLTGGRLFGLINNAGYGQPGPLEEVSDEDLRRQFETNVFGLMAVTRAFLPLLRAHGGGRILNVSSVGGRVTFPLFGAYHASKYAVEAMSDALRVELRPFGIEVVVIEPGPIRSAFADTALKGIDSYRGKASPYAAAYAQAERLQAISEAQASGPEVVTRAIAHALTARRPLARYLMPRRLHLLLWLSRVLPTRVMDWFMARLTGLTPARLGLGAQALQRQASEQRAA